MNDPGVDNPIRESFGEIKLALRNEISREGQESSGPRAEFRRELQTDEEEEEVGFFQPKRWWFTSTAFPLIAGTFGPLANLFSICALVQTWRVAIPMGETEVKGERINDPPWLIALNSVSLALALVANLLLLFNFAHRVRFSIAQPLTISLWYIAAILLIVPLALTRELKIHPMSTHAFSQSYYYAIISAAIYVIISTLLVFNVLGAYVFNAYPPSFNSLTIPQRTLMLQTMSYVFYLAIGAGLFSGLESWEFVDGLYFSDYTLLTIGLGTDFPLQQTISRALLIPYAACGITMIGLVVGSIRGLVLERGKTKVIRRAMGKQREKYTQDAEGPQKVWHKQEFQVMRDIERKAENVQRYSALGISSLAFLVVWLGGALVFWFSEQRPQSWTYFESLYFTYTTLLTIGYGDFFPQSNSGKPFLVIWSLIAIPAVTVLISNMSDTIVIWMKEGTLWVARRTILPERQRDRPVTLEPKHRDTSTESTTAMGEDIERLGEAVEKEEETHGRKGSMAAKIAKEISLVAKDVGRQPPKKYTWKEWERWLDLLDMVGGSGSQGARDNVTEDTSWTWIGDDGPLLSRETETEWVLGRLCSRLEEVLERELERVHKTG